MSELIQTPIFAVELPQSGEIDKIIPALIAAQDKFTPAVADVLNPHFNHKYVDLSGVLAAVGGALRDHNIAIVQQPILVDSKVVLLTRLVHESGQWLGALYPVNPVKQDPQGLGAALTYARRYSLMAIVGIAPEDDDGNYASGRSQDERPQGRQQRQQSQEEPPPAPPSDGEQAAARAAYDQYAARLRDAKSTEECTAIGSEIAGDRRLPREASTQLKGLFDARMRALTAPADPPAEPPANGKANGRAKA